MRRLPDPASRSFVLIDDARHGGTGRLFADPVATIIAERPGELADALHRMKAALAAGHVVAGYLAYEAAAAFEPRWPLPHSLANGPLLWFGVFERALEVADVAALLPPVGGAQVDRVEPLVDQAWHAAAVGRVLDYVAAGDVYQINLTFPSEVGWSGDPLALYARLRRTSLAGHGGIVAAGDTLLLSASPELFFSLAAGQLTARPMKGTAPRCGDAAADRRQATRLLASAKDRAENLMITDLLRNDLSRVAVPGSVCVPSLFAVEAYPTLFQMTSTVQARLPATLGPLDVLRAAFPCGSITGAPKLRAAEIVAELELAARGPYTGAIGWMSATAAHFNVAIRTLQLVGRSGGRLGLGSAIVADSVPASEWQECLAKAAFLTR